MSGCRRFPRVLGKHALAVIALGAHACTSHNSASHSGTFTLCSDNPAYKSAITVDFGTLKGSADDYTAPLANCGSKAACISFPIVLSVPPKLPTENAATIRWSIGGKHFSVQSLPGSNDAYMINAQEFDTNGDPAGPLGTYTYSSDFGVMTLRIAGIPHGWVRCRGRLTFDDLRTTANSL